MTQIPRSIAATRMTQLTRVSTMVVALLPLAGCGTGQRPDAYDMALLHNGFALELEAHTLPDGHPPVFQGRPALPPGHPPLSDAPPLLPEGHPTLPEGHPRCPAGGLSGAWPFEEFSGDSTVAVPPLVST